MKCPKCENEINVRVGIRVESKNCRVLKSMTAILTVQCEKCGNTFQVPIQGQKSVSIEKQDDR